MRIVQIEDFFHPEAGYQINILSKYLSKFGHEVIIISSTIDSAPDYLSAFFGKENIKEKDDDYSKKNEVKIIRLPVKSFRSGRAIFTKQLFYTLKKLNPDIIFCHGNDTFASMKVINWRNKLKKPLIFDNHMLKMASKNKFSHLFHLFYKLFYAPIFKKEGYIVIRTQDDDYVERHLGIPLKQCPWISYGSDTMLFKKDEIARNEFRRKNDIADEDFVVLYAGKLDDTKGGRFLADAFLQKFNVPKKIVLLCVGNTIGERGKEIEHIFSNSKNKVIRFKTQKYIDLPLFYQSADLCVFPKQCSLSFYDAQACGLPVLSESNNINVKRCSHSNGWNFIPDDLNDFRAKIEYISMLKRDDYLSISKNAHAFIEKNYNYEAKAREYEKLIIEVVKGAYK